MSLHGGIIVLGGLLLAASLALFVYNMFRAYSEAHRMGRIRLRRKVNDRQYATMKCLTLRLGELRTELKARCGNSYERLAQPADQLTTLAVSALLDNRPRLAIAFMEECSAYLEQELKRQGA